MLKPLSLLLIASALALGGCASSTRSDSPAAGASQGAPVQRIAPAVTVPAASAGKVLLFMTGPKNVVEAKDWNEFKREWRETFADHAKEAGIAFGFADELPPASSDEGTLLLVEVNDYRIVGIAARIWFGIMTGNAFIDAKVSFRNLRDGAVFGEQQYNTSSSAISGVFAKVTPQQVDAIATNVFVDLKAAR